MINYLTPFMLLVLGLPILAVCEEQQNPSSDATQPDAHEGSTLRKLIDESVDWYQLRKSVDSAAAMKPRVIMRWPNSLRGSPDGATVIWIADGRPEAIASIYPWAGNFYNEFDSLSRGLLVATRGGNPVWSPTKAGLEFHAVPDWPVPALSPVARLRQMKRLADQFGSTLLGWNADDSEREELRLVPSPLYRYDIEQSKEVLDGALFAFATGTDPEAILVIEAVQVRDEMQWQYAFVRSTSAKLEARWRGNLVWAVDRYPEQNDPRGTHIQFSRSLGELIPPEK